MQEMSLSKRRGITNSMRESLSGYLFIAPSIILFAVFVFFPLGWALTLGFFDFDLFFHSEFIGLSNFKELLNDRWFKTGLKVTALYTVFQVPLQLAMSLITALYVSKNTRFRKAMRSVYFLPVVCSMTAVGIVFIYVFNPVLSPFMYAYYAVTGQSVPSLFFNIKTALPAVIGVSVWKNFGYTMVIMVAGLQGIPQIYYEAAEIDGANARQRFLHVTIPQLFPTLNFCLLTTLIGSMQAFDQMYVTTQGGPVNQTRTLVMYIYEMGFVKYPFRIGYAAAMAEVLFLLILLMSFAIRRFLMAREEDLT